MRSCSRRKSSSAASPVETRKLLIAAVMSAAGACSACRSMISCTALRNSSPSGSKRSPFWEEGMCPFAIVVNLPQGGDIFCQAVGRRAVGTESQRIFCRNQRPEAPIRTKPTGVRLSAGTFGFQFRQPACHFHTLLSQPPYLPASPPVSPGAPGPYIVIRGCDKPGTTSCRSHMSALRKGLPGWREAPVRGSQDFASAVRPRSVQQS